MYRVSKRNGTVVDFDMQKIKTAIQKAFDACETPYHDDVLERVTLQVTSHFTPKIKDGVIAVEDIQDSVEAVLSLTGYLDVAKAYILYREQHKKTREAKETAFNYRKTMEDYLKVDDWRVKENASVSYSLGGLILSNSGAMTANYWLNEVFDKEIADAHRNGDIHLHDLSMLSGYCAGWSLKQLIEEGLGGVTGKISSAPASHLSTLCNQMVNFIGVLQNEWAGQNTMCARSWVNS